MKKEDTLILKGFAIMFMVFLHLFNQEANVELCKNYIYIFDEPLVLLLSRFTQICVPMYLFLSGYGLYLSYSHSNKDKRYTIWNRILSLLINYWIILIIFVFIGYFINSRIYPGSLEKLILNVSTFSYSYNGEWWFLFPYLVLVLFSKYIFTFFNKVNSWVLLFALGIIYFLSYVAIYFNREYLYTHDLVYKVVLLFNVLFPFGLGVLFAKGNIFGICKEWTKNIHVIVFFFLILFLIVCRIVLSIAIFNSIFAVLFIVVVFLIRDRSGNHFNKPLIVLGRNSTNIWLVHTFFCYYLFKDFIYSFRYPILIFLVLLIVSLLTSKLINMIYYPIKNRL